MRKLCAIVVAASLAALAPSLTTHAQDSPHPDLGKDPTLYVLGYAHLDTEWRWEYPQVINEYIRNTMEENFRCSRSIRTIFLISAARTAIAL